MSAQGNIQQQVYTRGREGIFRTNEGLDTVAKSAGLDNQFIKKNLHPFCVYQAPQELRQINEQELNKYPESLTVFNTDSGELVIGRSLFAGTDFTGQRDSIFVHNFIVPKGRVKEFVHNPNGIFRCNGFLDTYDAQINGKSLPELETLPYLEESHPVGTQAILDMLGIDETIFKQLLWAVMMSISSNKKVYIALDVSVSQSSLYAKKLLEILYHCLPYGLRRRFGFMTYNNEPQGKKFINVMFVEKGSIRLGDRTVDKEYIFDFPNQRFLNVELPAVDYFVDLAYANRERPEQLRAFYEFAEEALIDMDLAVQVAPSTYYQLCALFLIEQGQRSIYESAKEATVSSIMQYLTVENVGSKRRLDELFWQLVEGETSRLVTGYTPSLQYLETMIDYYRVGGIREVLVDSIIRFLFNDWNHSEDNTYSNKAFQSMLKHAELFKAVAMKMLKREHFNRVLEAYALERLEKVASMKGLLDNNMSFWLKQLPEAMMSRYFQEQFIRVAKQLLDKSYNRIDEGLSLHEYLSKLYRDENQLKGFCDELRLETLRVILSHVELEEITAPQLEGLTYMLDNPLNDLMQVIVVKDREKLQVLKTTWLLMYQTRQPGKSDNYDIVCKLLRRDLEEVQKLLKRFVKSNLKPDQFEKVLWAFYEGDEPRTGEAVFAYAPMLNFVHQTTEGTDTVYDFLNWSTNRPYFLVSGYRLRDSYMIAIQDYFTRTNEGVLKNRKVWSQLKSNRNETFVELLKKIKLKQANPLWRLLNKLWRLFVNHYMKIILAVAGTAVAVLLVIGGLLAYEKWFKKVSHPPVAPPAKVVSSTGGTYRSGISPAKSDQVNEQKTADHAAHDSPGVGKTSDSGNTAR